MKKKKLNSNNYLNLTLLLLGIILITIASSNIYKNYYENKISQSYISKYVAKIQLNELENASVEFSPDTFIYISYTGSSEVYNLEVKLKKYLKDNDLTDNFIYMDLTEFKDDDTYLEKLNKVLSLPDNGLSNLPSIIYYKDNKVIDYIDSDLRVFNIGNFTHLLEKYEILKND